MLRRRTSSTVGGYVSISLCGTLEVYTPARPGLVARRDARPVGGFLSDRQRGKDPTREGEEGHGSSVSSVRALARPRIACEGWTMKKLSTITVLLLAISAQACASETDPATDDEGNDAVEASIVADTVVARRDAADGLATGKR